MKNQDQQLMLDFQNGDEKAFVQIVESYKNRVMSIAYRYLQNKEAAEDLAQEVFIKIYNARESYRAQSKLFTWIYRITVNTCLNELRSKKDDRELFDTYQIADWNGESPGDSLEIARLEERIKKALEALPERQRMAVILQKYEGHSYEEIGRLMNCSKEAVDSLIQRAKITLKQELIDLISTDGIQINKNEKKPKDF